MSSKIMGLGEKSHFMVILPHILVFFAKLNHQNLLIFVYVLRNIYSDNIYFLQINSPIRFHKNPPDVEILRPGCQKTMIFEKKEGGGIGPKFYYHEIAQGIL